MPHIRPIRRIGLWRFHEETPNLLVRGYLCSRIIGKRVVGFGGGVAGKGDKPITISHASVLKGSGVSKVEQHYIEKSENH